MPQLRNVLDCLVSTELKFQGELLTEHGVALVDSAYTWRLVGGSHDGSYGEGGTYGRRADSDAQPKNHDYAPLYPEDLDKAKASGALESIDELLAVRLAHKKARRFEEADDVQETLRTTHGLLVDDRDRSWTIAFGSE